MWTKTVRCISFIGKEFWLGLENMHALTAGKDYVLRIRLTDANGVKGVGYYTGFYVAGKVTLPNN